MTQPRQPGEIEPALEQVERELIRHLHDACALEPEDVREESTGELMRLEDALLAAARAAEEAIALRRQLRAQSREGESEGQGEGEVPIPGATELPGESTPPEAGVREFTDREGRRWRAWYVMPGRARRDSPSAKLLGAYRNGWLAFETLEGTERRRLAAAPADWHERTDAGLAELLEAASDPHSRGRSRDD